MIFIGIVKPKLFLNAAPAAFIRGDPADYLLLFMFGRGGGKKRMVKRKV